MKRSEKGKGKAHRCFLLLGLVAVRQIGILMGPLAHSHGGDIRLLGVSANASKSRCGGSAKVALREGGGLSCVDPFPAMRTERDWCARRGNYQKQEAGSAYGRYDVRVCCTEWNRQIEREMKFSALKLLLAELALALSHNCIHRIASCVCVVKSPGESCAEVLAAVLFPPVPSQF